MVALGGIFLAALAASPAVTAPGALARALSTGELSSGPAHGPQSPRGAAWTAVKAPLPAGAAKSPHAGLWGVACPSAAACVAVGYYTDSAGSQQVLLLTGHGAAWTAATAPLPPGADRKASNGPEPPTALYSLTCPSVSVCVATGYYTDSSGGTDGLLLTKQGPAWTAATAPMPGGSFGEVVYDVACPSPATCVAVGSAVSGPQRGVLLTRHGSAWTATAAPPPAHAGTVTHVLLRTVTCPSADSCVATGGYTSSSGRQLPLLVTGHGTSWETTAAPLPAGVASTADAGLSTIACPTAAACVATGVYTNPSGGYQPFVLTGRGSAWTARRAPLPADAAATSGVAGTAHYHVACPSAAACVATGHYTDTASRQHELLLTGYGAAWNLATAPLPAGAAANPKASLWQVACPSVSACIATGYYTNSAGRQHGLLLTGHGAAWKLATAPLPAGAATNPKTGLWYAACPSVATCVVAGDYTDSTGSWQGLLLTGPA
jgi:hypothetical protein